MRLLTVNQAAERIAMSPSTVRNLCNSGVLVVVRPSGNPRGARRISEESIQAYLQSLVGGKPEALAILKPEFDDSEQKLRELTKRLRKAPKAQPA